MAPQHDTLATRYRPRTIRNLIGQQHAAPLLRSLRGTRATGAILISGPSGVGKSTSARLIAAILNCASTEEVSDQWEPCGTCRSCVGLLQKSPPQHTDYEEVNAADSRGIDAIRRLIDLSDRQPSTNYRVIVLDEAHALTKQAISALLKPIEEPPPRTVYVLCTTERGAIPTTIASRCQDLRLRPLEQKDLGRLLKRIVLAEKWPLTDQQLMQIARAANGLPRVAVSYLESIVRGLAANADVEAAALAVQTVLRSTPESVARQLLIASYTKTFNQQHFDLLRGVDSMPFLLESMLRLHMDALEFFTTGCPDPQQHPNRAWRVALASSDTEAAAPNVRRITRALIDAVAGAKRYEVDGYAWVLSVLLAHE